MMKRSKINSSSSNAEAGSADVFARKGAVGRALAAARASLAQPARPSTPGDAWSRNMSLFPDAPKVFSSGHRTMVRPSPPQRPRSRLAAAMPDAAGKAGLVPRPPSRARSSQPQRRPGKHVAAVAASDVHSRPRMYEHEVHEEEADDDDATSHGTCDSDASQGSASDGNNSADDDRRAEQADVEVSIDSPAPAPAQRPGTARCSAAHELRAAMTALRIADSDGDISDAIKRLHQRWSANPSRFSSNMSAIEREQLDDLVVDKLEQAVAPEAILPLARWVLETGHGSIDGMAAASRALFNVSKTEVNDGRFLDHELVMPMISCLSRRPLRPSAAAYLTGVVKNITTAHARSQAQLLTHVDILIELLNATVSALEDPTAMAELLAADDEGLVGESDALNKAEQILVTTIVHVTTTLRNLCGASDTRIVLLAHRTPAALVRVATCLPSHVATMFNVVRVLSKLSIDAAGRTAMLQLPGFVSVMTAALNRHMTDVQLVIRICFVLGNLTGEDDQSFRRQFLVQGSGEETGTSPTGVAPIDVAMETVVTYCTQATTLQRVSPVGSANEAQLRLVNDALIKAVRLLANLCIDPELAGMLGSDICISMLCDLITRLDIDTHEELVLNILGAVANLSFFDADAPSLAEHRDALIRSMISLLLSDSLDVLVEVCRALANFSRLPAVCERLCDPEARGLDILLVLLDHSGTDVVLHACGVLLNMSAAAACREPMLSNGTVDRVLMLCQSRMDEIPEVFDVAGKVLFNFIASSSADSLHADQLNSVADLATSVLQSLAEPAEEDGIDAGDVDEAGDEEMRGLCRDLLERVATLSS